jgi:cytidylate kinase
MGTVVFPNAPLKLFLTATVEERAKRRFKQLQEKGFHDKFDAVVKELKERDERDQSRSVAPTKPAHDAIILDTTSRSIDQVYNEAYELMSQRGLLGGSQEDVQ